MPTSINVDGLHHGAAPIPAASRRGPLLISSGINGMDPTDGSVPDDAREQVRLVFANAKSIVEAAGGTVQDIVKMTFFVPSMDTKDAINEEWNAMFPDPGARPARHTLTYELRPPLLLQSEIFAHIQGEHP
jgi:2-iminobutanoate/2-iminopropanoate deaminase